jgi:hypothetical protein
LSVCGKDFAWAWVGGSLNGGLKVKRLVPCLALVCCAAAVCGEPEKPTSVQAVMYAFTYNAQTLAITHAQVIGGYPSVDSCRQAMPKVAATGSLQLDAGEEMQLQCSGIHAPGGEDAPASEPVVASTKL